MESFPKIHPGKKPFFVFSEKSHFLVSKAHLQVIVKQMSLNEGEKASLILSKINVYCSRGGKKLSRLQYKQISVQRPWETPQFNVAFQRLSRALTVAAEITDNVLFIHTKHASGLQKKINIYSLITVYSLYSSQLSLAAPS